MLSVVQALTLLSSFLLHGELFAVAWGNGLQYPLQHGPLLQEALYTGDSRELVPDTHPMNSTALIDLVRRVYLEPLDPDLGVTAAMENVTGTVHWVGRWRVPLGDVKQVDIRIPRMTTCRPVIRGTKRLHSGIACSDRPCSIEVEFAITQNYETTEGLAITTTIGVGIDVKGVSASVSTTRERSWTQTWARGSSSSVKYVWNLDAHQHCFPGMAHVELQCDVDFDTVHYDTWYRIWNLKHYMVLEDSGSYHRPGGPWNKGQWCRETRVSETPLRREADWHVVLPDDRARGLMYKHPASALNR
ncbi:MAG: hypothetical protein L6R41_006030, partial [Letrouitia leprolyta]